MRAYIPEGKSRDLLSEFVEAVYRNCIATFENYRNLPVMRTLTEVDALFRSVLRIPYSPEREYLLPSFVGRAHSAYLGGVVLSAGGQAPESYALIRLCLENALYALFIQDDPTIREKIPTRWGIWVNRGDNDMATTLFRNTFRSGTVIKHLIGRDSCLGKRAEELYERAITYGAHPNFAAHASASKLADSGGINHYLQPDTGACRLCIQTVAQAGTCSLQVLGLAIGKRYDDAGIYAKIRGIALEEWPDLAI
jgi:hypothetical protein